MSDKPHHRADATGRFRIEGDNIVLTDRGRQDVSASPAARSISLCRCGQSRQQAVLRRHPQQDQASTRQCPARDLPPPHSRPDALTAAGNPRVSGILVHPTSLPGPYGIGELGHEAMRAARLPRPAPAQRLWQVLPLGPTGYGDLALPVLLRASRATRSW